VSNTFVATATMFVPGYSRGGTDVTADAPTDATTSIWYSGNAQMITAMISRRYTYHGTLPRRPPRRRFGDLNVASVWAVMSAISVPLACGWSGRS